MPNLISVERLSKFYESDSNYFVLLYVGYDIRKSSVVVDDVKMLPIEFLSWDCLTIGALGWGQIQIANANKIDVIDNNPRRKWMLDLCDTLFEFYPREISKIADRIDRFKAVQTFWNAKPE